ncbi:hypothetical protein [Roseivivax isoporae]|uniref:Transmembrane protein n=1 Tax=Roseivivax isoporae LMG 25204 TaxID=1449351 RepID=X7F8U2_9RHOB|nr:hypothetical protein [Roseivivax isoporae]ETX28501.1 hypothetical protein RISW2_06330 [Roseivivax isoporae LMG 25204]
MTFSEAVAELPDIVRIWVLWLTVVMFVVPLVLALFRETRMAGYVALAASFVLAVAMNLFYAQVGMVRLLGLPHILVWTPLLIWLAPKLRAPGVRRLPRALLALFCLTILVSLVFDYVDVIRWIAGDRASLIGA